AGKFERLVDGGIKNLVRSFFDEYEKENAEFRANAGLPMEVIREEVGDCCDWCADLADTYDYWDAPKEVWQRHEHCRCMVVVRTTKGLYKDAHTKKEFESRKEARREKEDEILNSEQWHKSKNAIQYDENFIIINAPDKWTIDPDGIRESLMQTETGGNMLVFLDAENAKVYIGYGVSNPRNAYGEYDPFENIIKIYADRCQDTETAALTTVHEGTHMMNRGRGKSIKENETDAYTAEMRQFRKSESLSQEDIDVITEIVNSVCDEKGYKQ
ncbi:MAG: hypothetical protein J5865_08745, partial [Lachnospiraceae bacterium]|nr:hypothetical protein [Lachnospiraceae bacterium]